MSDTKAPTHAAMSPGGFTPLDRIIERKGPYIKHWCRLTSLVQPYLTKRDISHIKEGRATIFKYKDGIVMILKMVDGKPKWRKAHVDPMHLK